MDKAHLRRRLGWRPLIWMAVLITVLGAVNYAVAQSNAKRAFSLNSPASFPVDI